MNDNPVKKYWFLLSGWLGGRGWHSLITAFLISLEAAVIVRGFYLKADGHWQQNRNASVQSITMSLINFPAHLWRQVAFILDSNCPGKTDVHLFAL